MPSHAEEYGHDRRELLGLVELRPQGVRRVLFLHHGQRAKAKNVQHP
jgi:hypothetical protein